MRKLLAPVFLALMLFSLGMKKGLAAQPGPAPSYGGTLVIGDSNPPTLINPVLTNQGISVSIQNLVFNRLIRFNAAGEIEPDLASSWEISPDGRVYTFHLRNDVRFHDGEKLTSKDVLYTYRLMSRPETASPYASKFSHVGEFAAVDDYTFRVVLHEPAVSFLSEFTREILPEHIYAGTDIRKNVYNYRPVGTGSFRFKEWKPNGEIVLEANEDYFEGRPYLDRIVFKTYPNRQEVWSAFMRQEIDLVRFMTVADYEITRKDDAFKAYAIPVSTYTALFYNLNDPSLRKLSIRRAIGLSIDVNELMQEVENGYAIESTGPFMSDSWAFNPQIAPMPYDPSETISLFHDEGWADADGDGVLEKDGKPFVIRTLVDAKDRKMKKLALLIRQQLQEVGIKTELVFYESEGEMKRLLGDSQAHLLLFAGMGLDPNGAAKGWFSKEQGKGQVWLDGGMNAEIDRLIVEGRRVKDKTVRQRVYRRLHKLLYQKQPARFLYFPYVFHAISRKIQGADEFFNSAYMSDYTMKDFYVKKILERR